MLTQPCKNILNQCCNNDSAGAGANANNCSFIRMNLIRGELTGIVDGGEVREYFSQVIEAIGVVDLVLLTVALIQNTPE